VRRATVCVVDDDRDAADVLCEGLRQNQIDAVSAGTAEEALAICKKDRVALVLLDVCLPDIDGYEVCRRLKADPATRDIEVVFVTVKGTQADISRGYEVGAADYITKPFNLPMVMVRVESVLRNRKDLDASDALADHTYTDELTGLGNRTFLLKRLAEEVDKAHRYGPPVSCVVFDVDDLRPVDEELGIVSMDDLLVELAMTIRSYSRTSDLVARYDGTVLAAILPHCPIQSAYAYAKKILAEVDSTTFSDPNLPTKARLSIGIAACRNGAAVGAETVLGEAMRGLLQAKSCCGQRIVARQMTAEAEQGR